MNCYIDAGNSRIKGRLQRRSRAPDAPFAIEWPVPAESAASVDNLVERLDPSLTDAKGRRPAQIAIASVADEARREQLESALTRLCPEAKLRWLGVPRRCCHVRVGYDDHEQLGIDRFCAMIEARERSAGGPLAVINAGTAITLDLVEAGGRHLGGLILPGVVAQAEGLRRSAPGLAPALDALSTSGPESESDPAEVTRRYGVGTDTNAALSLGRDWMLAAALDQMLAVWSERLDDKPLEVFVSGGDAERLAALVDPVHAPRVESDLVLAGVARLARARR